MSTRRGVFIRAVRLCGIIDNWLLLTEQAIYVAGFDQIFCAID